MPLLAPIGAEEDRSLSAQTKMGTTRTRKFSVRKAALALLLLVGAGLVYLCAARADQVRLGLYDTARLDADGEKAALELLRWSGKKHHAAAISSAKIKASERIFFGIGKADITGKRRRAWVLCVACAPRRH